MKKFKIIYADPPWSYGSKSKVNDHQGKSIHGVQGKLEEAYSTMTTGDIKKLPVKDITDSDCACFLWCTDSHLKEGIEVLEAWGFKYKTIAFNWIKKTNKGNTFFNVAPWTLKSSEICLFGTKGSMTKYKKSNSVKQLIEAERTKHSKKPEEAIKRIEELFGDIPRLEMFCRFPRENWDSWGNEIENQTDIYEIYYKEKYCQCKVTRDGEPTFCSICGKTIRKYDFARDEFFDEEKRL